MSVDHTNLIFQSLANIFELLYLDDIFIFTKTQYFTLPHTFWLYLIVSDQNSNHIQSIPIRNN